MLRNAAYAILAEFDLCKMSDAGDVDEVWLFGGPYFGYWESALAGTYTFPYKLADERFGTCNANEWATAGRSTGSATLTFQQEYPIEGVVLYDRACPEQVLGGRISFGDGSGEGSFGALDDAGTRPTVTRFTPRMLQEITVHIDQSSGTNPGLGEVSFEFVRPP